MNLLDQDRGRGERAKRRGPVIGFGVVAGTLNMVGVPLGGWHPVVPGCVAPSPHVGAIHCPFRVYGLAFVPLDVGRVKCHPAVIARLRILLPSLGLAWAVFGVAVDFTCDPTSSHIHPFRLVGAVMSGLGLFVFLTGLTLAAPFPPEGTMVG